MPSRKTLAAAPHPIFSHLDSLARQSGLVRRESIKFSPTGFLLSLLQCVSRGACSLNHIAITLGSFEPQCMTRQAMLKRFSPHSSSFLLRVIGKLLLQHGRRVFDPLGNCPFRRVLVEDSTVVSMAKSNAEHFPGNGNGRFMTAGCKVNLVTDLLSGRVLCCDLHAARSPDQLRAWDILEYCREGDLIVRDMGYFGLDPWAQIEALNAFWISRLPASVSATDLRGLDLVKHLKKTKANRLEMTVLVGRKEQHRCRLVATRLSPEVAAKHRRKRRRDARKRRGTSTPLKEGLIRDGWSLIVTNLPVKQISARKLYEIYALRWSIEIQFRALKQACRVHQSLNHKTNPFHIEAMVMAAMIFQLLTLRIHADFRHRMKRGQPPSIEKLSDAFAAHLLGLNRETLTSHFAPDPRHLTHDRRKRITQWDAIIHCLG